MLQQAERRWGWDSNPGLSGPSTCSLHGSVPGRWGHLSALGRKPEKKEGFLGTATKAPPQHQTPIQVPIHLDPHRPLGIWTIHTATCPLVSDDQPAGTRRSSHASTTHHEGPAPLVLTEAVASPGAQGRRRHLPERRLTVLGGILPPQASRRHLRHRTQEEDFPGASLHTGGICHTMRAHSAPERAKKKRKAPEHPAPTATPQPCG